MVGGAGPSAVDAIANLRSHIRQNGPPDCQILGLGWNGWDSIREIQKSLG